MWLLFQKAGLCVSDLAGEVGISCHNASTQLRTLSARGLITPQRTKLKVFYFPEVNEDVEHAEVLLSALHQCAKDEVPLESVIRQATAFTHLRRIFLVQVLDESPRSFVALQERTGISASALSKHLNKLESRHFIKRVRGEYQLCQPKNSFGRVLLKVARS